jgi:hypothetical protein
MSTKTKGSSAGKGSAADKRPSSKEEKYTARAASEKSEVSADERYLMIQTSAYDLAEKDGFRKDPLDYWLEAEQKIAQLIGS